MEEKVTVTLLTYNQENYIADAILGIINQIYDNIELIILDDASTDSTPEIIENYIPELKEKCTSVKFLRHQKNTGNIPANCNEMMRLATGKYIKDYAGDDIMLPNCLKELVDVMEKHPDVDVVHSNCFVEGKDYHFGDELSWLLLPNRFDEGYESDDLFAKEMLYNRIIAPTSMIRENNLKKYGYYDEQIDYEDYEMWLRITSRGGKFYFIRKSLSVYRRTPGSITEFDSNGEEKLLTNIQAVYDTKKKYLSFVDVDLRNRAYKYFYLSAMHDINRMQSARGMELLKELIPNSVREELGCSFVLEKRVSENKTSRRDIERNIVNTWLMNNSHVEKTIKGLKKKKIAVYGYGRIGENLVNKMILWGMPPAYVIDRKYEELYLSIPIYSPENEKPKVDIVISTVISGFYEVKKNIEKNSSMKCINLMEIIYGLY